jgi:hypothetical protein
MLQKFHVRWKATLLSLAVVVFAGLYSKHYHGPASSWVHDSLGGVFYDIFWCVFFSAVLPQANPGKLAATVLAATCCIEFLQLWHPPFLEAIRGTFAGAAILGSTFDWTDFPYYFIGSWIGWQWVGRWEVRKKKLRSTS